MRRRLWTAIPTTGLVLGDGVPVARKRGRRLDVLLDVFAGAPDPAALRAAADRLARARGCAEAHLG